MGGNKKLQESVCNDIELEMPKESSSVLTIIKIMTINLGDRHHPFKIGTFKENWDNCIVSHINSQRCL